MQNYFLCRTEFNANKMKVRCTRGYALIWCDSLHNPIMTSNMGRDMHSDIFEKYIETYGTDIYSFCVYLTKNKNDAEDLFQQTFLTAVEKDEIEEVENPKSYFISIAVNLWNNQKRKFLWRKKKADIVCFQGGNLEQLADYEKTVEEQVLRQEEIETVRKCIMGLPDKMRIVILLYYRENLTIDEIALLLKIPSGTVKSRMHQAKNKIRERLIKDERQD